MPYLLVFLVATASGVAVATLTLRAGRVAAANPETWTEPYREGETAAAEGATTAVRRPLPSMPTPKTRAVGAAGLLLAVLVGAGTIAFLSFMAWMMIKGLFN
jgi:hypothetical protein